ncbi:MAG: LPS export ABC transporter permease LptG [Pseudomonadota bacterium]
MTLWTYLLKRFSWSLAQVTGVILLLVLVFAGVENMRALSRFGASFGDSLMITALQAPDILNDTFPLVLMLAALTTYLGLSRSSELVVIRAAGVSGITALHVPVFAAIVLGVVAVIAFNPLVSVTREQALRLTDSFTATAQSSLSLSDQDAWLRQGTEDGQTVIQAQRVDGGGQVLTGVTLHDYGTDQRIRARFSAETATLTPGAWELRGVRRWALDPTSSATLAAPEDLELVRLPTTLTVEDIQDRLAPPDQVPIWALPSFIDQLERAGFSALRHRLYFATELARPALFAAMVLIGAGLSMRHVRFGQMGIRILTAVLAGFALYFFKDFSESLGANGTIPILLAAGAPPAAAILLATALLLHLEDG